MSEATGVDGVSPDATRADESAVAEHSLSRRGFVRMLGWGGAGATVALGGRAAVDAIAEQSAPSPEELARAAAFAFETATIESGHQPGIATPQQAHASFIAFDLDASLTASRIKALLQILTDDSARLMTGTAPIADQEPEMAGDPAGLTVTMGYGPGLVDRVNPAAKPSWLKPLPGYKIDKLEDRWSGGDFLLQICADDPITLAHARRVLLKDARAFTTVRWVQDGFLGARGARVTGTTMRNLFGQLDGTVNPRTSEDLGQVVWIGSDSGESAWLHGGSSLVIRRISMDLERWDEVDRPGREASIGRRLDSGAPLTGTNEHDAPDFEARTPQGFHVIGPAAHIRRARGDGAERILRRPYNYDTALSGAAGSGAQVNDSGLIFAAYQANPEKQFAPMQARLAEADLLNTWTTPIGSAVFAIPGLGELGEIPGKALFE
ncbi:Dyp-type peroxidase [Pseudoclavibacter albus]|uniref:Dyp-type peroxidase n=1 Tax=Pseudoclavibacter albus TaxID=272241 RepID=UPI001F150285|nr:Dyp-type peroxidase [Pseudoclavibacter alba]